MRKRCLIAIFVACLAVLTPMLATAQQNHGVTLTWNASLSQASCTSPCSWGYNIYEGAGPGLESSTPLNSSSPVAVLTYTDNGSTMNAYSGTTRCYVVRFKEVSGGVPVESGNSNEVCFSFPPASLTVVPPTSVTGTMH